MANIKWDTSDFQNKSKQLLQKMQDRSRDALKDVAEEVLRLSQFEVPHDTGQLQNTGHTEPEGDDELVGYNKPYAARLHEHPEYRFQKGRKGKYLEDPVKKNIKILLNYYTNAIKGMF